ncbi:hemerythrin domain-containing protein [Bythopirellula polymerisocia]|nr:hemerythrin domain-containing protein [Bythopirellula polymerisocia]
MRPTEILMQEHRVIEQVLDCLEVMAQRAEAGALDVESAKQAIDFFSNFADKCHHGKEEDCLFPLLEEKGFSREQGPTGVMLHEHEAGRKHVQGMATAVCTFETGVSEAKKDFVSHAKAFIQLLREHILKEDHCLFQMSDQALSEEDQLGLLKSFAHVEHDDLGPGTHEKYLAIATELAKRFRVTCQASNSEMGICCSEHQ